MTSYVVDEIASESEAESYNSDASVVSYVASEVCSQSSEEVPGSQADDDLESNGSIETDHGEVEDEVEGSEGLVGSDYSGVEDDADDESDGNEVSDEDGSKESGEDESGCNARTNDSAECVDVVEADVSSSLESESRYELNLDMNSSSDQPSPDGGEMLMAQNTSTEVQHTRTNVNFFPQEIDSSTGSPVRLRRSNRESVISKHAQNRMSYM